MVDEELGTIPKNRPTDYCKIPTNHPAIPLPWRKGYHHFNAVMKPNTTAWKQPDTSLLTDTIRKTQHHSIV